VADQEAKKRYKKDHMTKAARLLLPKKNNSGWQSYEPSIHHEFCQEHTNIWNHSLIM
jgi:hypothetical protein